MQKRAIWAAALGALILATFAVQFGAQSGPPVGAAKVSANVVALLPQRNGQVGRKVTPGH